MDNKAQVTFEYFTIISILILVSALVMVFATTLFFNKEGLRVAANSYMQGVLGMLG